MNEMDEDTVFKIIAEQFCRLNQTPLSKGCLAFHREVLLSVLDLCVKWICPLLQNQKYS